MNDSLRPAITATSQGEALEPVDGSVFAYQVSPSEGMVYVTIAGPDDKKPIIVAFDREDLNVLRSARRELKELS
jgi:hypothetical protein